MKLTEKSKIYFVELKEKFRSNFYYFCNGKKQMVSGMNDDKPFYHCITVNSEVELAPVPPNKTVIEQLDVSKVKALISVDEFIPLLNKDKFEFKKFMYVLSVLKRNL